MTLYDYRVDPLAARRCIHVFTNFHSK